MALNEDEQTEAVFKSVRAEVDPVSGNEVPPGSLPEEVRDDIPAMLSEGEYVVPADVLRFYGVKFFEDLRTQAKMGLAEMDANGRIGGEPIEAEEDDLPFTDEELMVEEDGMPSEEEMNAALGGLVGYNEGGMQLEGFGSDMFQQDPDDPTQVIMGSQAGSGGYELITYYGPAGQEVNIPFFNGTPLGAIPAGYTQTKPDATAASQVLRDDPNEGLAAGVKSAYEKEQREARDTTVDYTNVDSVSQAVDNYYAGRAAPALASLIGGALVPGLGLGAGFAMKMKRAGDKEELLAGIDSRMKELDPREDKDLYGQYKDLRSSLNDRDAYKKLKGEKGWADMTIKEILGFDGEGRSSRPDYSSKLSNLGGPQKGLEWMGSERDAYNAAVERGDDNVVQHFESINRLRDKQNTFADKGLSRAEGAAMGLSESDMDQAEKYGGSLQRSIDKGEVEKSGGFFSSYEKVEKDEDDE